MRCCKPCAAIGVEIFSWIFELNVQAARILSKAVSWHLRAAGRIINISSVGTHARSKELLVFAAPEAALEGLRRCLAAKLDARGHTLNAVNPGPVQMEPMKLVSKGLIEMQKKTMAVENRLGSTDNIAQIVGSWLRKGVVGYLGRRLRRQGITLCFDDLAKSLLEYRSVPS